MQNWPAPVGLKFEAYNLPDYPYNFLNMEDNIYFSEILNQFSLWDELLMTNYPATQPSTSFDNLSCEDLSQAGSLKKLCNFFFMQDMRVELLHLLCYATCQVLKVFPNPITVTTVQFAVGSVIVFLMWTLNIHKRPKISGAQLVAILPLAMVHTLGNLFTNMSLGKVAVSFTHTIKAMEPFFSVILSAMFLGERPTPWVVASLVPIVGGVALASLTEASFNWAGFWSAMASNLTNQSRNVLSKKFMVKKEESLDNITLFSIITIMSFFLLAPVTFFTEGVKVTPAYLQSVGLNVKQVYIRSLLAAICFHAYQQKEVWPMMFVWQFQNS